MDEAFLRANARLPGPRANLELLARAAEDVDADWAMKWAAAAIGSDPTDVFLVMVGLVALGRLAARGDERGLGELRRRAADDSWRVREGVAIGLQRLGDERPERLAEIAREWARGGSPLEARAAVAGVAEPRLLRSEAAVDAALDVLDAATSMAVESRDRVLRQALGYAWSVVVAADPAGAMPRFRNWERHADDGDVAWILRENLAKARLKRLGK